MKIIIIMFMLHLVTFYIMLCNKLYMHSLRKVEYLQINGTYFCIDPNIVYANHSSLRLGHRS